MFNTIIYLSFCSIFFALFLSLFLGLGIYGKCSVDRNCFICLEELECIRYDDDENNNKPNRIETKVAAAVSARMECIRWITWNCNKDRRNWMQQEPRFKSEQLHRKCASECQLWVCSAKNKLIRSRDREKCCFGSRFRRSTGSIQEEEKKRIIMVHLTRGVTNKRFDIM